MFVGLVKEYIHVQLQESGLVCVSTLLLPEVIRKFQDYYNRFKKASDSECSGVCGD